MNLIHSFTVLIHLKVTSRCSVDLNSPFMPSLSIIWSRPKLHSLTPFHHSSFCLVPSTSIIIWTNTIVTFHTVQIITISPWCHSCQSQQLDCELYIFSSFFQAQPIHPSQKSNNSPHILWHYANSVQAVVMYPSVCHNPVLYQNS